MSDRPTGFPHVLGHTRAAHHLGRAIARDQLHHGLIVVGPRGLGKATFALGLASALHCREAPGRGCGECRSCRRIAAGLHTGVERIEPEQSGGTIKVEQARELATRLELAPFEGRHHVVIVDPADALTEQAYNALLKTIEEPRPGVHFVMLASALDRLLPTILSRCLVVRLGRLDHETTMTIVRNVARERGLELGDERLQLAVRLSDGCPGRALEFVADERLEGAFAVLRLATQALQAGLSGIFAGDGAAVWRKWSEEIGTGKTGKAARERALLGRIAELWLLHIRERLRGHPGLPGVTDVDASTPQLLRAIDRVTDLFEAIERNANARLAFETTMLALV